MADPAEKNMLERIPDGDNIDRLSELPNCVLLHILSRFKTKDAAATSILSTRWRDLFVSLPDVRLIYRVDSDASGRDKLFSDFIDFANRVIRQRNKAPIRKLVVDVMHFVKSYRLAFESLLISAAAALSSCNVQRLIISVRMDKTTERFSIPIPPGIFSSKTLVCLSVNFEVDWNVPDFVWLPNLKRLYLIEFRLVDEDSIQRLLQGCPLLEHLMLKVHHFSYCSKSEETIEVEVLHISSPSLKSLVLCWNAKVELEFTVVVKSENLESLVCSLQGQHKVTIDAPNLKSLTVEGHVLDLHIKQSLVSIDKAVVRAEFLSNVTNHSDLFLRSQRAFKFLSGLVNVKSLYLSQTILQALYFSQGVLPKFKYLNKLKLSHFRCNAFPRNPYSKVLSSLFESSLNLEVLIIDEVLKDSEDGELDSVFQEALSLAFVGQLKEIEIRSFEGWEHEFKLIEYFLKNGISLKKMTLIRDSWKTESDGCHRILSSKKCAEDCQILFITKRDALKLFL
ncbi:F-box/FBD/LRR-repeat protein At5g22660-like [Coffea arabica]|uniref:F-box/FBD/LRR-repeat protein At5g22660-like n=1 Tax=Coffea arabica TaxID=13443 RepID=A0A6P6X2U1_COFAR|nr:F-box/FBD/LRR-repeat protein At5g22660-like [Coffea arabica]